MNARAGVCFSIVTLLLACASMRASAQSSCNTVSTISSNWTACTWFPQTQYVQFFNDKANTAPSSFALNRNMAILLGEVSTMTPRESIECLNVIAYYTCLARYRWCSDGSGSMTYLPCESLCDTYVRTCSGAARAKIDAFVDSTTASSTPNFCATRYGVSRSCQCTQYPAAVVSQCKSSGKTSSGARCSASTLLLAVFAGLASIASL